MGGGIVGKIQIYCIILCVKIIKKTNVYYTHLSIWNTLFHLTLNLLKICIYVYY